MSTDSKTVHSTTGSVVKELQTLGLSEKQAELYLLLVEHGELRIREIVRLAKLPRSSVYENIRKLSDRGLIEERHEEHHKLIAPYPLSGLKHDLRQQAAGLEDAIAVADRLERVLGELSRGASGPADVRYYRDVPGARQLFWNTLKARDTVYVYSAFGRSQFVGRRFYQDFVLESRERGIREKVLINPTQRALDLIKRDDGSALARTKVDDIRSIPERSLGIQGETFVYGDVYAHVYLDGPAITGFEIRSPAFGRMQRSIFKALWASARPLRRPA